MAFATGMAYAQLGEVAGFVYINASVGGSGYGRFTIINPTGTPIPYDTTVSQLTTSTANQTSPVISVTPMNGTVQPHSSLILNITAHIPNNDKVGVTWTGFVNALMVPNQSSGGGARVELGVAKRIFVNSEKPVQNYLAYEIAAAVILAAAVAALAVRTIAKKRAGAKRGKLKK